MTTALLFLSLFIGLSAALTVVVADLLSPEKKAPAKPVAKSSKRPIAA